MHSGANNIRNCWYGITQASELNDVMILSLGSLIFLIVSL